MSSESPVEEAINLLGRQATAVEFESESKSKDNNDNEGYQQVNCSQGGLAAAEGIPGLTGDKQGGEQEEEEEGDTEVVGKEVGIFF